MAYITTIGAGSKQIEYRLSEAHGCGGGSRHFSHHATGGEQPLTWIGRGLSEVGIKAGSELTEVQFGAARRLMHGYDPRTGEELVSSKREIPGDAKLPLAPLVRAVDKVAARARTTAEELLGKAGKVFQDRFARARRSVSKYGEAARLRADHAGQLADLVNLNVNSVWDAGAHEQAEANLFITETRFHDDGTATEKQEPRRVSAGNSGYDITFTLPKSMSLLLAFADEDTAARVEQLYMQQVQHTFAWLEEHTAYGMRGWHGNGHTAKTVQGSGLIGWTMVHRAARPVNNNEVGDPHWHVHLTVANMTKGTDGKWSTIAAGGRDLMRHAATVDHMLKALVRYELHQQLGVRFERNRRTGAWELVGIPDDTLRRFSKRHSDIAKMLTTLGYDAEQASRAQERIAEHRSRPPKHDADVVEAADATLQEAWQGEERAAGNDPQQHMQHVHGGDPRITAATGGSKHQGVDPQDMPTVADIAADLAEAENGLTAHTRRFTRADTLARVADAMPYGYSRTGAIEAMTERVLETRQYLSLPSYDQPVEGPDGERAYLAAEHMANADTYTTQDVVAAETIVLRAAKNSHADQLSTRVGEDVLALAVTTVEAQQGYALSGEQYTALRRLVTTGRAIDTVQGQPGTGKTTLMRAARLVYEAAGYVVAGAATAAVAAHNLQSESGITSTTVASYVDRIQTGDSEVLRGVDVLVLDEANLTEDRDRAALYQRAQTTGTKIVEIGDGKQLRGVGVGSLFARVHEVVEGTELAENRRQADEDERAALAAWRDGRYAEALSIWHGNGRFHATEHASETTAAMVSQWWQARQNAPEPHTEMRGLAMLAATNDTVDRLNVAAQAVRDTEGELGDGYTYSLAGDRRLRLHVGEHVMLRVNDRTGKHTHGPPVYNGYRAVVRDIGQYGALLVEWQHETPDGVRTQTANLSAEYVGLGGVSLGYAMTVHKAEGLTVGGTRGSWHSPDGRHHGGRVLFHAAGADNPSAYVALSRHRQRVDLFGPLEELESQQQRYLVGEPRTRAEVEDRALGQLAEHARRTETHGDDRPVVADLGISEFLSETAADRQADAARAAERAETERIQQQRQAEQQERQQRRAEREAERVVREELRKQQKTWAAALLREVWRHEPNLAEKVIAVAEFDKVARNLAAADECGYDPRAVLADTPTSTIASPRITDKAMFTAWSVDHTVQRFRTGEAAREEERAAEWDQACDQAADLLDEMWAHRPELVEVVTQSSSFDKFVHSLDTYTQAGLDPRELIGQVSTDKLADSTIYNKAAFAAYAVHRVGDRQLDEIEHAQQRVEQQHEAAETVRQAWSHVPAAAERVTNHRSFQIVTEQITLATRDGHDVDALLGELSPDVLAGPQVDNPAGRVAYALKRAVAEAEHGAAVAAEPESIISEQTSDHVRQRVREWANARPDPVAAAGDTEAASNPELERLAEINERAAHYYSHQLDQAPHAVEYLTGRVLDLDAVRTTFTVGYAPNQWRGLTDHLRGQGYSEQDLLDAGVSKHNRRGELIDRFRDRVVLGIRDEQDRIAGFTGRDLSGAEHAPKYLNTPATELFNKSQVVFGLVEQRSALADGACPVLVEGPFDVVALSTVPGVGDQVAPIAASGTAVTGQHLAAVARATGRGDLIIGLDADTAGQNAAARAASQAAGLLPDTRVVTLPDGHDPASWVSAHISEPDQIAAPYLDHAQQHTAAQFMAEHAIETYFANRAPQHRDEIEGRVAATQVAAKALAAVDTRAAARVGVDIATRFGVDPSEMPALIAQYRSIGDAAEVLPLTPEPEAATEEFEPDDEIDLIADLDDDPVAELEPGADEATEPDPEFTIESEIELGEELAPAPPERTDPEPEVELVSGRDEPAPQIEDWHDRTYGHLTEADLNAQLDTARQQAQRSATQREAAEQHAAQLREAVEAGQGPEVTTVDEHLAELRHQAALAREADEVETTWQTTVDRAGQAAENRVLAERERDQLGWFARARRTELDARISELAETERAAQREADELAERAAPLHQQTGDRNQRRRILTRTHAAESDYEHARHTAQGRDEATVGTADRRAARLGEYQAEHDQQHHALEAEHQLRAEMPEYLAEHEATERAVELHAPEANLQAGHIEAGQLEAEAGAVEPHASLELESQIGMVEPQAEIAEPDEPEL